MSDRSDFETAIRDIADYVVSEMTAVAKKLSPIAAAANGSLGLLAESLYQQQFGKPPGSNRTARLRKKRRTLIAKRLFN